jgi:large subunit ribosomal protein L24
MKIKKGDKVRIITGKDKGREGVVEKIYENKNKVLIPAVNMYKKHVKKSDEFPNGGIIELPRAMNVSNVMLISQSTKKVTRVGYVIEGNKKFRIEKKTNERIK